MARKDQDTNYNSTMQIKTTEQIQMDVNHNLIKLDPKSFKAAFKKDKEYMKRYAYLFEPHRSRVFYRNPIIPVFNVFNDVRKFLNWERKATKVRFPDHVVKTADEKGELMGREREVTETKIVYQQYAANTLQKRKKKYLHIPPDEFRPHLVNVKKLPKTSIEKQETSDATNRRLHLPNPRRDQSLSEMTQGIMFDINTAGSFLHDHRKTTFFGALKVVDIPDPKRLPSLTPVENDNLDPPSIEKIIPISQDRIGLLAVQIWIFSYCIPLFTEEEQNKPEFERLIDQYAILGTKTEEFTTKVEEEVHNFYVFIAECMRAIEVFKTELNFQGNTQYNKPPERGCLILKMKNSKKDKKFDISDQNSNPNLVITISKINRSVETDFKDLKTNEKISVLKHLLYTIDSGLSQAVKETNWLVDDIVETTRDLYCHTDLLFLLGDMFEKIKVTKWDSNWEQRERDLSAFANNMHQFTASLKDFVKTAEHVFRKILEFRDMMQLSREFLKDLVKFDLEPIPSDFYSDRKAANEYILGGCIYKLKFKCCKSKGALNPEYSTGDFYRIYYEDAMNVPIIADNFSFTIKTAKTEIVQDNTGNSGGTEDSNHSILSHKSNQEVQPVLKSILKNADDTDENFEEKRKRSSAKSN